MPDYGHDLLFGCFLTPVAEQAQTVLDQARLADALDLDLVTVQDHPYQPAFLDTWTLLSVIAARTSRVRVVPNVANLPLRPPAILARAAASLDILSGGRVELGLGAGAFWDAIEALGGPRRSPGEAVTALEEAIEVIRALWTPGRTPRIDGAHYRLAGAKSGPYPVHPLGIWLGAYGPRMLALTGRVADGWLPSQSYAGPERLHEMNARVDEAAVAAGRHPSDVRRLYNLVGGFGTGSGFLQGDADDWVEQLAGLALEEGMSGFIISADPGSSDALRRFAEEVAPAVRDVVDHARTSGATVTAIAEPAAPEPAVVVREDDHADLPTPTPDDGHRFSSERVWDESIRPSAPPSDDATAYSASGKADGQHLIDVHNHLRGELAQLRDLIQQVTEGSRTVGDARDQISQLTMRQNNWTLGTYCETYCRIVTVHHTLEDRAMFPRLRRADARLEPVVDRLAEEHEVIAEVLEQVDRALVDLVADPKRLDDVQAAVDLLTDTLLSHLSYEERVLVEPLARLDIPLV